jgi:glycosyltransferase involved in cell wall biosynthesis
MAAGVPVLANGEAAVPETMGGAGVVFTPKDLEFAAEWLGVLAYDQDVRRRIVLGQRERLADFGDHRTARELDTLIAEFA